MNSILALLNLGGTEIVLILFVILLLFGARKIPELARGLGLGIKEFKKATREVTDEISNAMDDTSSPSQPSKKAPETNQPAKPAVTPQSTEQRR